MTISTAEECEIALSEMRALLDGLKRDYKSATPPEVSPFESAQGRRLIWLSREVCYWCAAQGPEGRLRAMKTVWGGAGA